MSIETQKMELRTSIKALNFKRSRLACQMAELSGITGEFFHDQIPFHELDPKTVNEYNTLSDKIYNLGYKLQKLEYLEEPERHAARQQVYDFVNFLTLEENKEFLKKVGCTTNTELVEKVIDNPNLINEVVLNE